MDTNTCEKSAKHPVVSREEWLGKRIELLKEEKEFTRRKDELSRQLRDLPWVRIGKGYRFQTVDGEKSLADLFGGKIQLVIQHFMLGTGWEEGCPSCSFMADHTDGMIPHLAARDVTMLAVSRAPLAEIEVFRKRMGWRSFCPEPHGSRCRNARFASRGTSHFSPVWASLRASPQGCGRLSFS
jgi:predicted dithiol-disulfide oxidoreductase (DUF899 family)